MSVPGQVLVRFGDSVRTRLWPLPTLAVVVALILGYLLPRLELSADSSLPAWLAEIAFDGDASAARTVLGTVATSLITVTSLTFSLTVVTLQLASSQFSPRLLRTFNADLVVQGTLALFLATFAYSLTVLRSVRSGEGQGVDLVPRLSITFSFLLAAASVITLVLFLAHVVRQIRVETMLRQVHEEASTTLRTTLPDRGEERGLRVVPDGAHPIVAVESGFLLRVDSQAVVRATMKADAVALIDQSPGSSVVKGVPVGWVWGRGKPLDADQRAELQRAIGGSLVTGYERSAADDVSFGVRQLTDVAVKALSPGINDPTTAVHAVGYLSALLGELAERQLGPRALHDDDGVLRVVVRQPDFAELLAEALTQPRVYGSGDPDLCARLYRLLAELAWRTRAAEREAIKAQLAALDDAVENSGLHPSDQKNLSRLAAEAREALAGGWARPQAGATETVVSWDS